MTKPFSKSITVGHAIADDGHAVVYLVLDNERVGMSPKAARKIAAQLLDWAEHADEWRKLDPTEAKRQWLLAESEMVAAEPVQLQATTPPPGDAQDGAEAQG